MLCGAVCVFFGRTPRSEFFSTPVVWAAAEWQRFERPVLTRRWGRHAEDRIELRWLTGYPCILVVTNMFCQVRFELCGESVECNHPRGMWNCETTFRVDLNLCLQAVGEREWWCVLSSRVLEKCVVGCRDGADVLFFLVVSRVLVISL